MRLIEIFTEGNFALPYKGITENFLSKVSERILELTETDKVSVTVILTDNETIHTINKDYRGKDKPTDVISFAYRDEPFPSPDEIAEELGDIYISLEKAEEQAAEYGVTMEAEVKRLLIHGILHLLGYDHEKSEDDEIEMQALEEKLINII
jgi:probable rRNA maturation factor